MVEYLSSSIFYWHWIVFGIALITIELFAPVFVMLWLGLAAIVVGILQLAMGISVNAQLILWVVLSAVFLLLWHKFISPKMANHTLAGLSREAIIGQVGLVLNFNKAHSKGRLRFSAPIIGNDEWEFISEEALENGDRVEVTDISGNRLIVKAKQ